MRQTYFIAGAWQYDGAAGDYNTAQKLITAEGNCSVFTPFDVTLETFSEININSFSKQQLDEIFLRAWIAQLCQHGTTVLTMTNWEQCSVAKSFINIARHLGFEVIPIMKFSSDPKIIRM
jgi:hypothetical protein